MPALGLRHCFGLSQGHLIRVWGFARMPDTAHETNDSHGDVDEGRRDFLYTWRPALWVPLALQRRSGRSLIQ